MLPKPITQSIIHRFSIRLLPLERVPSHLYHGASNSILKFGDKSLIWVECHRFGNFNFKEQQFFNKILCKTFYKLAATAVAVAAAAAAAAAKFCIFLCCRDKPSVGVFAYHRVTIGF